MADFKSIQLPEELMQRLYANDKPRELYELNWLSYIRPDPHDITSKLPGIATVRVWAKDGREALRLLEANPQTLSVNGEDQELPVLVLQGCISVKPGISEESMMQVENPLFDALTGKDIDKQGQEN